MEYLEKDLNAFHREDYLTARVAYEVYELRATLSAIFGAKLANRDVVDFIPKFERKEPEKPLSQLSEEERQKILKDKAKRSQSKYLGLAGMTADGKMKDTRTPSQKAMDEHLEKHGKGKGKKAEKPLPPQKPKIVIDRKDLLRTIKGRKGKK